MKIAYLGNFRASFCTEVHLTRELVALGHYVKRIQEPPDADNVFLHALEADVDGCDLLIFQRAWGLPERATRLWRRLEANGTVTASYHLDLYVGLARGDGIETDPFWTTQHVFTPDGDPESVAYFAERGIAHHWSPPAIVSDECSVVMPGRYREELAHDVVFVGSYGYHDEWPFRRQLIDALAQRYGRRFRRYAGDTAWGNQPEPRQIRGQDLNDLYASARVVVGDSCFARPDTTYFSDRPFETYGRGAFMLFPAITKLCEMIGPYPSYPAGQLDAVFEMVDAALLQPEACRRVASGLAGIVHAQHTYRHRLAAALKTMGLS